MTLTEEIYMLIPIDSEDTVDKLLRLFKIRNTEINPQIYSLIINNTVPEMLNMVEEKTSQYQMDYHRRENNIEKGNTTRKKIKKVIVPKEELFPNHNQNPLSAFQDTDKNPISIQRAIDRLNQQYSSNSLQDKGYEYGLSDW